jgi:hypothetical protein
LIHSSGRQIEFMLGRFLRLFDETVQQHHRSSFDTENHPDDLVSQARPDFPQALAQAPDQRLADGSAILNLEYVIANDFPLGLGKRKQPFPNWLIALLCPEEHGIELPFNVGHIVPKIVRVVNRLGRR